MRGRSSSRESWFTGGGSPTPLDTGSIRFGADGNLYAFPCTGIERIDLLTRAQDDDDWTMTRERGRLVTHLGEENLFYVRTEGDYDLEVLWGDLAFERFFGEVLETPPDPKGCYLSSNSELRNEDGSPATPPHRLLYCPKLLAKC